MAHTYPPEIISGATYTKRSKDILEKLEWLTLKQRRNEQKAIMMYKITNNLAPEHMVQMFIQVDAGAS